MRSILLTPLVIAAAGLAACANDPVSDVESRRPADADPPATPAAPPAADRSQLADAGARADDTADRVTDLTQAVEDGGGRSGVQIAEGAGDDLKAAAERTGDRTDEAAAAAAADLTPATNAAEDARNDARESLSEARTALDNAGPEVIDDAAAAGLTPATNAAEDARNDARESTAKTRRALDDAGSEAVDNAAPAPDPAASARRIAADGVEEVNVPVTANPANGSGGLSAATTVTAATGAAVAAGAAATPAADAATDAAPAALRPNIVFLITDDQKIDDFGFLGGSSHTPHIDKLRAAGTYLSRHYVSSSVCSPSRYTCLTGQYASRNQSNAFKSQITPEGITDRKSTRLNSSHWW